MQPIITKAASVLMVSCMGFMPVTAHAATPKVTITISANMKLNKATASVIDVNGNGKLDRGEFDWSTVECTLLHTSADVSDHDREITTGLDENGKAKLTVPADTYGLSFRAKDSNLVLPVSKMFSTDKNHSIKVTVRPTLSKVSVYDYEGKTPSYADLSVYHDGRLVTKCTTHSKAATIEGLSIDKTYLVHVNKLPNPNVIPTDRKLKANSSVDFVATSSKVKTFDSKGSPLKDVTYTAFRDVNGNGKFDGVVSLKGKTYYFSAGKQVDHTTYDAEVKKPDEVKDTWDEDGHRIRNLTADKPVIITQLASPEGYAPAEPQKITPGKKNQLIFFYNATKAKEEEKQAKEKEKTKTKEKEETRQLKNKNTVLKEENEKMKKESFIVKLIAAIALLVGLSSLLIAITYRKED